MLTEQLFDFLAASPSCYHAVQALAKRLEQNGYTQLREQDAWTLTPGGKYFVTRNGSSLLSFRVPQSAPAGFLMAAAHTDSPTFKIKHNPEKKSGPYVQLSTEKYGGMLMGTWFDRPLSIAGRALVREDGRLVTRLIDLDRDAALIPNMPIHFNRDINSGYSYNPQTDMLPLFGGKDAKGALAAEIAAKAGAKEEDVVACDLFLYNRTPASVWGANEEFFSCPRIDDLECAYTTLWGFLQGRGEEEGRGDVWVMFDNEEVGSSSRQGACGTLFADVLSRVEESLGVTKEQSIRARTNTLLLSADNGHATHPNHPEKSDPANPIVMGGGVLLKTNASQKYTTSGFTGAAFSAICKKAGVPVQTCANRADVPGGSTLGNLLGHQILMPMVDIGLGQLAMHSAMETASCADAEYMAKAVAEYYNTPIFQPKDGEWKLGL